MISHSSNMIKLAGAAFALAALSATGTVSAGQYEFTEVVAFDDLDLRSDRDVERLDGRLWGAVKRVCGWTLVPSIGAERELSECREDAWTRVEPQRDFAIAEAREGTSGSGVAGRTRDTTIRIAAAN